MESRVNIEVAGSPCLMRGLRAPSSSSGIQPISRSSPTNAHTFRVAKLQHETRLRLDEVRSDNPPMWVAVIGYRATALGMS